MDQRKITNMAPNPWMTTLKESPRKQELHKKTLHTNSSESNSKTYRKHRNVYNRLKRQSLKNYYERQTLNFKNNTKELWRLINKAICKHKNKGSIIPLITVEDITRKP